MVTSDTEIDNAEINLIVGKIQAECTRRGFAYSSGDVWGGNIIDADPDFYDQIGDLSYIVAITCYCESDGGIDYHYGCPSHCSNDYPATQGPGTKITAAYINDIEAHIDLHDAACACDGYSTCNCDTNQTLCSCNLNILYCGNCSCNNNCSCEDSVCLCDIDEYGCYYDYCSCHVTCTCQNQCTCLSNCTNVGYCTCNYDCTCDFVCTCEFNET